MILNALTTAVHSLLYFIDEKEHDRDGKMLKMKAQFIPKNVEKFYLF